MAKVVNVKKAVIESVTLEFNLAELQYLCTMLECTGGSPTHSLRIGAASIMRSLSDADISTLDYSRINEVDKVASHGYIYFKDIPTYDD